MKVKDFARQLTKDMGFKNGIERKYQERIITAAILNHMENKNPTHIAKELGVKRDTVLKYLRDYDIPYEFRLWYKSFKANGEIKYDIVNYA